MADEILNQLITYAKAASREILLSIDEAGNVALQEGASWSNAKNREKAVELRSIPRLIEGWCNERRGEFLQQKEHGRNLIDTAKDGIKKLPL